jgi:HEAT repeat protein
MKLRVCSIVLLLGSALPTEPALAQAVPARTAASTAIQEALAAGDTRRAYDSYDRFVAAGSGPDAGLLSLIATEELRAIGRFASDDPSLQAEALERLARRGDPQAMADLQRLATSRPNTGVAAVADGALARLGDSSALARLASMASSSTGSNKAIVAEALGRSGSREHAVAVVPLLGDSDWGTRVQALKALAALDYTEAIPEVRVLLKDDNPQVRFNAAMALRRLGDAGGEEYAAAMARSGNAEARLEALRADRLSNRADVRAAARQLASDPDPFNRVKAAVALAEDDPAAALALLRRVAEEQDSTARRLAAFGLESLEPTDLALLRRLLEDQSGWVRMYAAGGVLAAAHVK